MLLPRGSVVGNGSHKLGRQTALEPQSLFTFIVDCKNSPVRLGYYKHGGQGWVYM